MLFVSEKSGRVSSNVCKAAEIVATLIIDGRFVEFIQHDTCAAATCS